MSKNTDTWKQRYDAEVRRNKELRILADATTHQAALAAADRTAANAMVRSAGERLHAAIDPLCALLEKLAAATAPLDELATQCTEEKITSDAAAAIQELRGRLCDRDDEIASLRSMVQERNAMLRMQDTTTATLRLELQNILVHGTPGERLARLMRKEMVNLGSPLGPARQKAEASCYTLLFRWFREQETRLAAQQRLVGNPPSAVETMEPTLGPIENAPSQQV